MMPWDTPAIAGNMLTAESAMDGGPRMVETTAVAVFVALWWGALWWMNRTNGSEDS